MEDLNHRLPPPPSHWPSATQRGSFLRPLCHIDSVIQAVARLDRSGVFFGPLCHIGRSFRKWLRLRSEWSPSRWPGHERGAGSWVILPTRPCIPTRDLRRTYALLAASSQPPNGCCGSFAEHLLAGRDGPRRLPCETRVIIGGAPDLESAPVSTRIPRWPSRGYLDGCAWPRVRPARASSQPERGLQPDDSNVCGVDHTSCALSERICVRL